MSKNVPFRVQSHVLKLLGDELIGHDRLAVFELVKNAYDADATVVDVTLDLMGKIPRITVVDNGTGMSLDTIEKAWLEVGTDSKRSILGRGRTQLGRAPFGEKGVGRLAVQKLGIELTLSTKCAGYDECTFSIDWNKLISSSRYLGEGLNVQIDEHKQPRYFTNGSGTRIEICELYNKEWSRREVRDLYRLVSSLSNPFEATESFRVNLFVPGREKELADLPSLQQMLESAVWEFDFSIDRNGLFSWTYAFTPPKFKGLIARKTSGTEKLQLLNADDDEINTEGGLPKKADDGIFLKSTDLIGIGPIVGKIYAFHKRDEILKASGAPQQIKKWLDNQTGVRVYRDNIRVFNYGEPGDDWLGLDARRINRPTGKLGSQSVIAQVALDLRKSIKLKEKTNREGFDENLTFRLFRRIVLSVFDRFQREHGSDRSSIDIALKGEDSSTPTIQKALQQLEGLGRQHNIQDEVKPILNSIQNELKTFSDVMVASGLAGMNLALVFHEVVHCIDRVQVSLQATADPVEIRREVDYLRKLLDTFKPLLQRDPARKVQAEDIVERATEMHSERFRRHNVVLSNWAADPQKKHSFSESLPRGLLVAALSNVIDNAIYWTRFRKERDERTTACGVLVLTHWDETSGGIIAVVDNGPGFQISESQFGRPFVSTRAGGMGLGLFYCKTVMESIGGSLEIMTASSFRDIVDFPSSYDGAAVVFSFKKK
jgi:signal transduction histidine kinase